eukprot:Seg2186.4 transcript_id=Seg2186.4/GoldUCD/mRNA.D3Y31 product="Serine/threonine-protein phosphatase 4 regulatory subunit 2" protein_id=Seg2186.4/GoldUCD/D3Y31
MENGTDKRLEALNEFIKQEKKVVTAELKEIIKGVAKNGKYIYEWETLKPLYSHELEQVMENFLENFPPKNADGTDSVKVKELENERNSILKTFNKFTSAPFTLQRISELIMQPRKHYKTCAKFFRGLTKNVLVVSTIDPEESDTSTVDLQDSDAESDERPNKKMRLATEQQTTVSNPNELRPPVLQATNGAMPESAVLVNGRVDDAPGQSSDAKNSLQAENQTPQSDVTIVDTLDRLSADKTEETSERTQEKQEDKDEKMNNEEKPHAESTSNAEDVHVTAAEQAEQKEQQVEQQQQPEQQTEQQQQPEQHATQQQQPEQQTEKKQQPELTKQQQQQTEQQQQPEQQTEEQQQPEQQSEKKPQPEQLTEQQQQQTEQQQQPEELTEQQQQLEQQQLTEHAEKESD